MIIATAGHVDHGKTTLLNALTGINTAHLPEEKQRGMTIDLGYAYWPQPDGRVLGFIDVPGHEKFLANMLAGVGGIDHALLVVACDDGVMPQTREHLAILRLSGLMQRAYPSADVNQHLTSLTHDSPLSIVLTKCDRVSAARCAQVRQQVTELLAEQGWQPAPCFLTAATVGIGICELAAHLQAIPEHPRPDTQRFRLAIDRAFSVRGAGLVVTGTALAGQVQVGDTLWLTGAQQPVRVRGLHAQNQPVTEAHGGQRIALNLSGHVEKQQITRGDWLLAQQPAHSASDRVLVHLESDQPLQHWQSLHLHHGARHLTGRLSLLTPYSDTGPVLAELRLDTPLWLVEQDRIILRDISARHTLGVAQVIDLHLPARGKRREDMLRYFSERYHAIADDCASSQVQLQHHPLPLAELGWARQLTDSGIEHLLTRIQQTGSSEESGALFCTKEWIMAHSHVEALTQRLLSVLDQYHQRHPDHAGVSRSRLLRMTQPTLNDALFNALCRQLIQQGLIANQRGWLHLPTHTLALSTEHEALWQQAQQLLGDAPWWVRDIAHELQQDEALIRNVFCRAAAMGRVTAVVKDRYYLTSRIQQFAALIRHAVAEQGSVGAADFRDQLGIGRKLAIQILEYFDLSGFTRRKGNTHLLRDASLFDERTLL